MILSFVRRVNSTKFDQKKYSCLSSVVSASNNLLPEIGSSALMGISSRERRRAARDVLAISINPNQTNSRLAVLIAALLRSTVLYAGGQDHDSALTPPKFL